MPEVHNALHRANELLRGFRIAFGLDSGATGVERLGETLTPIVDLFSRPEWALLQGERLCIGYGTGQTALKSSKVALVNPAGSGHLVTLECAELYTAASETISLRLGTGVPVGLSVSVSHPRDGRSPLWGSATSGTHGKVYAGADAGSEGIQVGQWGVLALSPLRYRAPIVLGPGETLHFAVATANIFLGGTLYWRERPLLPGELSL